MNFHNLHFRNIDGKEILFEQYRGKVCLVVNIASHCGFTPQLHDLETLYIHFRKKGFEVLAFPSNDFAEQEPLDNAGIGEFCKGNFLASFTIFEKSHVKGQHANPVFKFLRNRDRKGNFVISPMWNFQKYLIDRDGIVRAFFFPFTKPTANRMLHKIEALLSNPAV